MAGPERAYVSAIIVINYDNVGKWAGQKRLAFNTFSELSQMPEVYELIQQDIDRTNSTLSPGCRVRKYVNLYKEFDPDEGELTRTRKLKRTFLEEHYRELVNAIYEDKTEIPIEANIQHQDGRTGVKKTTLRIMSVKGAAS